MLQLFSGAEIETDAPRFDPSTAGLMEFRPSDRGDVRFTYVLPTAANRALLEATRFAVAPRAPAILEEDLAGAIAERVPDGAFRVVQTERGAIPMAARLGAGRQAPEGAAERIVKAGLAGGAARPSTGYAFLRIARWADRAAERIAGDATPPPPGPDRPLDRVMDAIFLSTAAGEPDRAAGFFLSMFEKVPPGRLLRFLSDEARLDDRLAVAAALPPVPFLKRVAIDVGSAAAGRLPAHRAAARRSPETGETDAR
jgi:lycopene beta-cyclase